jgi:hypothetical protein
MSYWVGIDRLRNRGRRLQGRSRLGFGRGKRTEGRTGMVAVMRYMRFGGRAKRSK